MLARSHAHGLHTPLRLEAAVEGPKQASTPCPTALAGIVNYTTKARVACSPKRGSSSGLRLAAELRPQTPRNK